MKPPTRQQLAKWCIDFLKELDEQIVKNAWLHHEYSFFPVDVAARSCSGGADPYDAHDERLLAEDEDTDEEEEMPMDEEDDDDE